MNEVTIIAVQHGDRRHYGEVYNADYDMIHDTTGHDSADAARSDARAWAERCGYRVVAQAEG